MLSPDRNPETTQLGEAAVDYEVVRRAIAHIRDPIPFVVPCHGVVGKSGNPTGYHWGLTRKRAMLGWEAGKGPPFAD